MSVIKSFAQSLNPEETALFILTEGFTNTHHAKTAEGVIKYGKWKIDSIIDSQYHSNEAYSYPLVKTLRKALEQSKYANDNSIKDRALLIGIAPAGGKIPENWLSIIKEAIVSGLHIISGLHEFLEDLDEIQDLAKRHQVRLWDLRNPDQYQSSLINAIAKLNKRSVQNKVVTMVGSDCSVGKMCTALELNKSLLELGTSSQFIATGQTGIMISGNGIPLDRVIGDFMAGSVEQEISRVIEKYNPQFSIVEGQGALLHPAYSSVTLSLLHGSNPDALILCHKANKSKIDDPYTITIPSIAKLIEIYENVLSLIENKSKVIGIAVNTSTLSDAEAREYLDGLATEISLPCSDPIRFGMEEIAKNLIGSFV